MSLIHDLREVEFRQAIRKHIKQAETLEDEFQLGFINAINQRGYFLMTEATLSDYEKACFNFYRNKNTTKTFFQYLTEKRLKISKKLDNGYYKITKA